MASGNLDKVKVVTPEFRACYVHVFEPHAFQKEGPKYSLTMAFDKATDISGMKKARRAAIEEKFGKDESKWPKFKHRVFRDGDKEKSDAAGFENTIFCVAKAKPESQPGLVNARRQEIISPKEFYAGCYARAEVIFYAYDNDFGKGVGISLQNIQKLRDGDKLTGKRNAEDVFDAVETGEDDEDNYEEDEDSDDEDMGF